MHIDTSRQLISEKTTFLMLSINSPAFRLNRWSLLKDFPYHLDSFSVEAWHLKSPPGC